MAIDQDIDEQIKLNEQILEEVPKKIAELQAGVQQLKDLVTGASYAVMVLKSIKIKNAAKPPEGAPPAPGVPAYPPFFEPPKTPMPWPKPDDVPAPPGEPCPAPAPTTPPQS